MARPIGPGGAPKVRQTHRGIEHGPNYTQPVSQFRGEQKAKKDKAAAAAENLANKRTGANQPKPKARK